MPFLKPEKRTPETDAFYARKYRQLSAKAGAIFGLQLGEFGALHLVIRYVMDRKGQWSKKTWHVYKSAIAAQIRSLMEETTCPLNRKDFEALLDKLSAQTQRESMHRGTRTSSLKSRRISEEDLARLLAYLESRKGLDKWAAFALTWCQAARLTGLRPCEWAHAYVDFSPEVGPMLVVANAKRTQGRANGPTRHLDLSGLDPQQILLIDDMGVIARHYETTEETMAVLQRRISKYLYRVARIALGRRKHYPCLYTFRHQFAADAKRSFSAPEVAALLGHGSDQTATRNYARAAVSTRSVMVKPIASEVANVRRVAHQRPEKPQVDLPTCSP